MRGSLLCRPLRTRSEAALGRVAAREPRPGRFQQAELHLGRQRRGGRVPRRDRALPKFAALAPADRGYLALRSRGPVRRLFPLLLRRPHREPRAGPTWKLAHSTVGAVRARNERNPLWHLVLRPRARAAGPPYPRSLDRSCPV